MMIIDYHYQESQSRKYTHLVGFIAPISPQLLLTGQTPQGIRTSPVVGTKRSMDL